MLLAELAPGALEIFVESELTDSLSTGDTSVDFDSWDLLSCWKQQQADRFGGGTPAPGIPRSQRQYDGDNFYEYCEPLAIR